MSNIRERLFWFITIGFISAIIIGFASGWVTTNYTENILIFNQPFDFTTFIIWIVGMGLAILWVLLGVSKDKELS